MQGISDIEKKDGCILLMKQKSYEIKIDSYTNTAWEKSTGMVAII